MQVIRKEAVDKLLAETTYAQRSAWSTALTERDFKAFWGNINWNGCIGNDFDVQTSDLNDLSKQFQMKSSSTTKTSTLFSEVKLNQHVPILDDNITVYEVKAAHSVLKEDKSSGDGWVKAMATNTPLCILYVCLGCQW